MKRAVLLNCLLDKAGLRFGEPLRGTASGSGGRNREAWSGAPLTECVLRGTLVCSIVSFNTKTCMYVLKVEP